MAHGHLGIPGWNAQQHAAKESLEGLGSVTTHGLGMEGRAARESKMRMGHATTINPAQVEIYYNCAVSLAFLY